MMTSTARSRFPFTATQWQELEHQALIYKYMVSGMPIPPDLLCTIRRSLDSSKLIPHHIGWNCFQMGYGKKIDPEPGRCRRTDGKKWRCAKEAYADSKYCERHMHRGRNRSRKPVEIATKTPSSLTKNTDTYSYTSSPQPHHYPFLSSHHHTTKFLLESAPYSTYADELKEQVDEHVFASAGMDNSWPFTMGGSPLKQRTTSSYLQLQTHDYYANQVKEEQPKKIMHDFFDEWPHKTQLSISIPNYQQP